MASDTRYKPVSYVFKSRGLLARNITDQAPEFTYLDFKNCLEREENAISSRYGFTIVNRDPNGTSDGQNYFFSYPVTSLAKLAYAGGTYRYAGTSDGLLYRRSGNTQGQYTSLSLNALGSGATLSGQPFSWVVTNCYSTSQPYLFIYDANGSIKDMGVGNPTLTGIDASPYTVNTQPYSPLLTLIDNFSPDNTYSTSSAPSGWAWQSIVTLEPFQGTPITDFYAYTAGAYSLAGGSASTTANPATPSNSSNAVFSGFPSVSIIGELVTLSATLSGSITVSAGIGPGGIGTIQLQYSIDGGVTWITFYSFSAAFTESLSNTSVSAALYGMTNLDTLQVRLVVSAVLGVHSVKTVISSGTVTSIQAAPNPAGQFSSVANGMLSLLSDTETTIQIPISSVASSGFFGGAYRTLTIVTQVAHGITGTSNIAIYGTSNPLTDGFYQATVVNATTLTVPFVSIQAISATGGFVMGGQSNADTCVLTNFYSTPYPAQFSAWGFYQFALADSFPVSCWSGSVDANSSATIEPETPAGWDLSINNQVTDDDLIILTLAVQFPATISNIRLQFDINNSGFTSSYYYKDISPAYYQQSVSQLEDAYTATEQQIFADTLGLLTGAAPDTPTAQLQPGNISTGGNAWVAVLLRRGDFLPVGSAGQSGTDWTSITNWQVIVTTNTVGGTSISLNGLYLQWGYGPSSFGGVGYDYRQTNYNVATGTESNPTPIQEYDLQYGYLSSESAPFYLSQAAQITGRYSTDPQVTHIRIYRRGGSLNDNWRMIDQVPNSSEISTFVYKDVVADASIAEAQLLALDNDPPVTSSLVNPIATTLAAATSSPGNTYYSLFSPQQITVADADVVFVEEQVVVIGYPYNLEQVRVISDGIGSFTAIVRLQHNAGEPVNVYAVPRQPTPLCALAYNKQWLAGDINNPHYLYFSKPGQPENFPPQNYIPVGSAQFPITIIANWRGTLFAATTETWYVIVGSGAIPYAQPTGSTHGAVANHGWIVVESGVGYRAADGLRVFTGADGGYLSLDIEWVYRASPGSALTPVPIADPNNIQYDIAGYYNNCVYFSYISMSGTRYRMVYDTIYKRFRYDDLGATAMLWERDTNQLLMGIPISEDEYAVAIDWQNDYDDGGWSDGALVETPIALTIQTPYTDMGAPHDPKQFNVVEADANTQSQVLSTNLLFQTEPPESLSLANVASSMRQKLQIKVEEGEGYPAYSTSVQQQISVKVAPILYQINIYAAALAPYRSSFDTYWIKMGTDESKIAKQGYFDYTSAATILVALYADDDVDNPYYTFTLPAEPNRAVIRVLWAAKKFRRWRMIANSNNPFQFWNAPTCEWKPVCYGKGYAILELNAA